MSWLGAIPRILLGLIFAVFGLNGFFHFIPLPEHPQAAGKYLSCLFSAKYFLPLLKGSEVVAGFLLLMNWAVGFALVVLGPIIVNIVCFHVFLAPDGNTMSFVIAGLWALMMLIHREKIMPLFR